MLQDVAPLLHYRGPCNCIDVSALEHSHYHLPLLPVVEMGVCVSWTVLICACSGLNISPLPMLAVLKMAGGYA